jgi:hypothetical protein
MTWETGHVTPIEINRLAAQVAANLDGTTSADEVLRRCVGMALSQDLSDAELAMLVLEVDQHSSRAITPPPARRAANR